MQKYIFACSFLMGVACSKHGEEECIKIYVGKPEEKRSLGRLRRRWVDNIKINLREVGWCGVNRMGTTGGLL
jgi:hypothetical protein